MFGVVRTEHEAAVQYSTSIQQSGKFFTHSLTDIHTVERIERHPTSLHMESISSHYQAKAAPSAPSWLAGWLAVCLADLLADLLAGREQFRFYSKGWFVAGTNGTHVGK